MNISDMQWTDNDLCLIIAFTSGYFCIVSQLGTVINLLSPPNHIRSFYFLKTDKCTALRLQHNSLYFYNDSACINVQLKEIPNEFTVLKAANPLGGLNNLIHAITNKPQLSSNEQILDLLSDLAKEEIVHFKIDSNIPVIPQRVSKDVSITQFINPFPTLPEIKGYEVVRNVLKMVEPMRWKGVYVNNIQELALAELENAIKILMICKLSHKLS